ncbi:MAG: Ger(x)C family spore germination protein [Bacillota bacterium]
MLGELPASAEGRAARASTRTRAALARGVLAVVLWTASALAAVGCWDRHELPTLALATAVAFDEPPGAQGVLMTMQVAIPSRIAGAGGGVGAGGGAGGGTAPGMPFARTASGPQGPTTWVVGAPGRTVAEALERITLFSSRLPALAHLRVIVLGEELARSGVGTLLDALARERDFRRTAWVVVARGVPAYRVLELPNPLFASAAAGIAGQQETLAFRTALVLPRRLHAFMADYVEPGVDPVVPAVSFAHPVPADRALTPGGQAEPPALLAVEGTAVFRKGQLVGWLSPEETRALVLLKGLSRQFLLVTDCPGVKGAVSVNAIRFTTRRKLLPPRPAGGGSQASPSLPRFAVRVVVEGNLFEQTCLPPLDAMALRRVEERLAGKLEADIRRTLARLHGELRADAAGFGQQLYRAEPALWNKLSPHWRGLLPQIEVDVEVQVRIRRTGLITGEVEPRQ